MQNGMTTKRCAELICIAASNKILESWIANRNILDKLYKMYRYFPSDKDGRIAVSAMLKEAAGYTQSKL